MKRHYSITNEWETREVAIDDGTEVQLPRGWRFGVADTRESHMTQERSRSPLADATRVVWLLLILYFAWAAFSPLFGQTDTIFLPPSGYHGLTFCRNGMVEMWVRDPRVGNLMPNPMQGNLEWEGILAHERTHVAQYQRYPNCNMAEQAWNTAPVDSSLSLEAEAYCAQAKVFLEADAMEPGELTGRLLLRLLRKAPERDAREVLELFYGVCPVLRPEEK